MSANKILAGSYVEDLYLLQRVAQRINSTLDLDTLLDQIVEDVSNTFGYDRVGVLLEEAHSDDLVIAAGWAGELCLKGTRFTIGGGVGIGAHAAASGRTFYAPDVRKVSFYVPGQEDTRSEIDIPLEVRGELIGIFNVEHTEVNAFSPERVRLLEALAGHVATAISNARMFQRERREKARMAKELDEARAVQRSLLPASAPAAHGFDLTGVCRPCREVGGDWYDFIPLGDGRLAVVLGDVSGKGLAAALLMSSTRTVVRLHAARGLSPRAMLSELNRFLLVDMPASRFVTLIYAVVSSATRTFSFASAGHLPPVFVDSNGARLLETAAGRPLGLMESEFSDHEIEMTPGSRAYLYSDGISEAVNPSLEEYGTDRILSHVVNRTATVHSLLNDVDRFSSGNPASDDMTVVMVAKSQDEGPHHSRV